MTHGEFEGAGIPLRNYETFLGKPDDRLFVAGNAGSVIRDQNVLSGIGCLIVPAATTWMAGAGLQNFGRATHA